MKELKAKLVAFLEAKGFDVSRFKGSEETKIDLTADENKALIEAATANEKTAQELATAKDDLDTAKAEIVTLTAKVAANENITSSLKKGLTDAGIKAEENATDTQMVEKLVAAAKVNPEGGKEDSAEAGADNIDTPKDEPWTGASYNKDAALRNPAKPTTEE